MEEEGPQLDEDVTAHLIESASSLGISVNDVLRRVLNVTPLGQDPRFEDRLRDRPEGIVQLLETLDARLRARNPGSHYVVRETYFGYRRSGKVAPGPLAERSQVYASIRVRRDRLLITMPIDPTTVPGHPMVRSLVGIGHHGIGDVEFTLREEKDIDELFSLFSDWLDP